MPTGHLSATFVIVFISRGAGFTLAMSNHTTDDGASIMSDTATLVEQRSDPPDAAILKPSHSTRASRISYARSQGRYSMLEYLELTFSVMFLCNNMRAPLVVAIDENFNTLLADVQRMLGGSLIYSTTRIKELRISWGGRDFGSSFLLTSGNIEAMLRLLKSRNGQDMIMAK